MKSEEELLQQIGRKIKQLRIDKGYKSYETFAFEHGLSRMQYWRMEKGENITLKTLIKLLEIHELSLSEFFSPDFDQ